MHCPFLPPNMKRPPLLFLIKSSKLSKNFFGILEFNLFVYIACNLQDVFLETYQNISQKNIYFY